MFPECQPLSRHRSRRAGNAELSAPQPASSGPSPVAQRGPARRSPHGACRFGAAARPGPHPHLGVPGGRAGEPGRLRRSAARVGSRSAAPYPHHRSRRGVEPQRVRGRASALRLAARPEAAWRAVRGHLPRRHPAPLSRPLPRARPRARGVLPAPGRGRTLYAGPRRIGIRGQRTARHPPGHARRDRVVRPVARLPGDRRHLRIKRTRSPVRLGAGPLCRRAGLAQECGPAGRGHALHRRARSCRCATAPDRRPAAGRRQAPAQGGRAPRRGGPARL